jgi:hypothetical protein
MRIRALFWVATVGCLAVACGGNLITSTGEHDGAAGAPAAGGAGGISGMGAGGGSGSAGGGSGSASDAGARNYCIPGLSADGCSGATFACPQEPTCSADAACPTLTVAEANLCVIDTIFTEAWETICGPYLVVTYWTVDHGSATFYDSASGAIVAILQGGNAGTSCQSGPPQFATPACSTLPYCGMLGCKSQLLCPDGGAPDGN